MEGVESSLRRRDGPERGAKTDRRLLQPEGPGGNTVARRAAAGSWGVDLPAQLRVFSLEGFQILREEVRAAAERERAGEGCWGGGGERS